MQRSWARLSSAGRIIQRVSGHFGRQQHQPAQNAANHRTPGRPCVALARPAGDLQIELADAFDKPRQPAHSPRSLRGEAASRANLLSMTRPLPVRARPVGPFRLARSATAGPDPANSPRGDRFPVLHGVFAWLCFSAARARRPCGHPRDAGISRRFCFLTESGELTAECRVRPRGQAPAGLAEGSRATLAGNCPTNGGPIMESKARAPT